MRQSKTKLAKCITTSAYFYGMAGKERRSYLLLIFLLVVMTAVAPFINILIPKYIIEEIMGNQNIRNIVIYVLFIVVGNYCIAVLHKIFQEERSKKEDWISRMFDLKMSEKSMKMKYEDMEMESVLDAEQKAEIGMSWYSGGIRGLSDCIIGICSAIVTFLGVVWVVSRISLWLLLAALLAVVVEAFCTSKINQASQEVFEKTPAINKFYSYIYTRITNREYAKELRLYDGTQLVEKKAIHNAKELNKMDNECALKQFAWGIPGVFASTISYSFSYCYLGAMVLQKQLTIGEFVMCITAIETFTNGCLLSIINHSQQLMLKCNFMHAFIEYMSLDNDKKEGTQTIKREDFEEIRFNKVSFKYPGADKYTLKDIDLTIHRGERISIVGINGAGKSTLVKLLCGLYDVTEGEIQVNGKSIREYQYEEYVRLLSVVFQDFKLFGYSLDENIQVGEAENHLEGEEKTEGHLQDIYDMSGISQWVSTLKNKGNTLMSKAFDEEGVEPSGGQAQKIAIARALYCDAPLVILDEPTAALDPVAEFEIYNHFNQLIQNKTAIYISHRLSSCKFCDKIIVLGENTILETGTHEELLALNGIYAEMFQTQAGWYVEKG